MNTHNNKRRRQSRKKMEEIFMDMLKETDLNKISVTDICKRAGVNRTTFYSNYEDIYSLADSVREGIKEEVAKLYMDEIKESRRDHNFLKLFCHIKENPDLYRTYFKLDTEGRFDIFSYDIVDAQKYYGNKFIEYHIEFFGKGLTAVIKKWLENDCRETPEEIFGIIQAEYSILKATPER